MHDTDTNEDSNTETNRLPIDLNNKHWELIEKSGFKYKIRKHLI